MSKIRSNGVLSLLCVVLLTSCIHASPIVRTEEESGRKNEWFLVYLRGKPAGYFFLREVELESGGVETFHRMRMRLSRAGQITEMESSMTIREDARGHILDFVAVQNMGLGAITRKGKVVGKTKLEVTTKSRLGERTDTQPFDPKARGPAHVDAELRKTLEKEGDSLEQIVFSPDVFQCVRQTSVARRKESVKLSDGAARELLPIDSRIEVGAGLQVVTWVDDAGHMVKTTMPAMGISVERSSRDAVLSEKFSSPPEVFIASSVKLDRPLPSNREALVYGLRLKSRGGKRGEVKIQASDAAGHDFQPGANGGWRIRVRRVTPKKSLELPVASTRELAPYLAANAFIESDDSTIRELAAKAIDGEKDAWRAAKKLEAFVQRYVRKKNLETAFATAKQVAVSRQGDCTEHAVLLAGLARASGIPSRVVAGLTYYRKSFVGHMWTEVWIGEWVPLDATIGKGGVDADHIGMATSALDSASISELFLSLIPILSGIELDVLGTD